MHATLGTEPQQWQENCPGVSAHCEWCHTPPQEWFRETNRELPKR
jgi:hypothetical protein